MALVPVPLSAAAAKELASFLERFGGIAGFVESLLDVPSGYLRHWHQQNLIRWYDKLEGERAQRKAGDKKAIPPGLLMPALQKIAMEDDDEMLSMWARLFANFQDPERRLEPNKMFVHLLAEMQPLDAKLIHHIVDVLPVTHRMVVGPNETPAGVQYATPEQLAQALGVTEESIVLSVHNLSRLGCLLARPVDTARYLMLESSPPVHLPTVIMEDGSFYLNSLGSTLVAATRGV